MPSIVLESSNVCLCPRRNRWRSCSLYEKHHQLQKGHKFGLVNLHLCASTRVQTVSCVGHRTLCGRFVSKFQELSVGSLIGCCVLECSIVLVHFQSLWCQTWATSVSLCWSNLLLLAFRFWWELTVYSAGELSAKSVLKEPLALLGQLVVHCRFWAVRRLLGSDESWRKWCASEAI